WESYRMSIEQWAPNSRIVYDKFHIMQHANAAIDQVQGRRVFPQGRADARSGQGQALAAAEPVGEPDGRQAPGIEPTLRPQPEGVQSLLLKESLDRLWTYPYEGAMLNYLQRWIEQLSWQRLEPFQKLAV